MLQLSFEIESIKLATVFWDSHKFSNMVNVEVDCVAGDSYTFLSRYSNLILQVVD